MRIAVASDDRRSISAHFGRSQGFIIYEVNAEESKELEYRLNTFTGHARGLEHKGHGHDKHGAILSALEDCEVVISHGMGRRIYDDLEKAGIRAFRTEVTIAEKAVEQFITGSLRDEPDIDCGQGKRHGSV